MIDEMVKGARDSAILRIFKRLSGMAVVCKLVVCSQYIDYFRDNKRKVLRLFF